MHPEKEKNGLFQDIDRLNSPLEVFIHHETLDTGGAVHPHWHYYMEIIYILEGNIEASCDDHIYYMAPGDLLVFYPQSVHSMHRKPSTVDKDAVYFVVMVDLNFLNITNRYRTSFSKIFRLAYEQNPEYIHFHRDELVEVPVLQLMSSGREEMWNKNYGYDVIICSYVSTLLTHLMRCLRKKGLNTDAILTAPDDIDTSIYAISKYIEQHCSENLRVQDLADICGMSYSYFAKLFRETYNQSCKEYIEFIRLNKVADLLLFTDLDLTYISQETGFSDCSHLIRTFKKWKGVTPKQWRKKETGIHPVRGTGAEYLQNH